MKKSFCISSLLLVALLVLAACVVVTPMPESAPAEAPAVEATFVCPDGTSIAAVFDNAADTVTITLPDETLTLPRVVSGSGARYSDETTTFWNKGNEALIEVNGETLYEGCVAEEAAASAGGITDITWQLVEIQYMNDTVDTPADPTQYTLMLAADGSFAAQLDCNRGRGGYEMSDSSLTFGEIASTRAMCPPESLADKYQQGLTDATAYVVDGGDLFIAFGPDAGILHFAPAAGE